jgi:hypothetical protein
MPLITNNLVVGGEQSPPKKTCEIKEEHPIESHYVIKQDGILERRFNTKSSYLTDMFSIDPDSE